MHNFIKEHVCDDYAYKNVSVALYLATYLDLNNKSCALYLNENKDDTKLNEFVKVLIDE